MDEPWFSARTFFVHEHPDSDVLPRRVYEERVVLFRATGFDDAINQAEIEARNYAAILDGCRYLGHADVFHLADQLHSGAELYSVLRDGTVEPEAFVERITGDYWNCGELKVPRTIGESSEKSQHD